MTVLIPIPTENPYFIFAIGVIVGIICDMVGHAMANVEWGPFA